jgi:hypothetical protein
MSSCINYTWESAAPNTTTLDSGEVCYSGAGNCGGTQTSETDDMCCFNTDTGGNYGWSCKTDTDCQTNAESQGMSDYGSFSCEINYLYTCPTYSPNAYTDVPSCCRPTHSLYYGKDEPNKGCYAKQNSTEAACDSENCCFYTDGTSNAGGSLGWSCSSTADCQAQAKNNGMSQTQADDISCQTDSNFTCAQYTAYSGDSCCTAYTTCCLDGSEPPCDTV